MSAGIVSQIKPLSFPSTSFAVHYILTIPWFYSICITWAVDRDMNWTINKYCTGNVHCSWICALRFYYNWHTSDFKLIVDTLHTSTQHIILLNIYTLFISLSLVSWHPYLYICNAFKCCNMKSFCTSVIHTINWIYLLFTSVTSTHRSQWNLQRILLFMLSSTLVCSSYF